MFPHTIDRQCALKSFDETRFTFQVVSYLPLSHVAGTFIDIYLSMWGGGTVHFADKMALQGTLLKVCLLFVSSRFLTLDISDFG